MAVGLGNSWVDEFGERRREEDLVTELGRKENTMVLGTEEICCTRESEIQWKKILNTVCGKN